MYKLSKLLRRTFNQNEQPKQKKIVKSSTADDLRLLAQSLDVSVKLTRKDTNIEAVDAEADILQSIPDEQRLFRSDIFEFLKGLEHVSLGTHNSEHPFKQTPPTALSEFQAIQKLSVTHYCKVYKALHLKTNTTVALKVYHRYPHYVVHAIEREIETQLSCDHVNILKMYSAFIQHDMIVLVLEYANHFDLHSYRVKQGSRLIEEDCKQFARNILNGIEYLHARHIVHRDIKPENLFVSEDMTIKIGDFGSCLNIVKERPVTRVGTVDFMAPEVQACPLKAYFTDNKDRDDLYYTSKCDIWSFGITLYDLLTGITPYHPLIYPAFLSKQCIDFLHIVVNYNPSKRLDAGELLTHEWLVLECHSIILDE